LPNRLQSFQSDGKTKQNYTINKAKTIVQENYKCLGLKNETKTGLT